MEICRRWYVFGIFTAAKIFTNCFPSLQVTSSTGGGKGGFETGSGGGFETVTKTTTSSSGGGGTGGGSATIEISQVKSK